MTHPYYITTQRRLDLADYYARLAWLGMSVNLRLHGDETQWIWANQMARNWAWDVLLGWVVAENNKAKEPKP